MTAAPPGPQVGGAAGLLTSVAVVRGEALAPLLGWTAAASAACFALLLVAFRAAPPTPPSVSQMLVAGGGHVPTTGADAESTGQVLIAAFHPPSPSVTLRHPPSPSITLRHPPSSSVTLRHPPSSSVTLRHPPSPSVTLRHPPSSDAPSPRHPSSGCGSCRPRARRGGQRAGLLAEEVRSEEARKSQPAGGAAGGGYAALLRNPSFVLLLLAYGIVTGVYYAIGTLINAILLPRFGDKEVAARIFLATLVALYISFVTLSIKQTGALK
jgi:hypothetical protein